MAHICYIHHHHPYVLRNIVYKRDSGIPSTALWHLHYKFHRMVSLQLLLVECSLHLAIMILPLPRKKMYKFLTILILVEVAVFNGKCTFSIIFLMVVSSSSKSQISWSAEFLDSVGVDIPLSFWTLSSISFICLLKPPWYRVSMFACSKYCFIKSSVCSCSVLVSGAFSTG